MAKNTLESRGGDTDKYGTNNNTPDISEARVIPQGDVRGSVAKQVAGMLKGCAQEDPNWVGTASAPKGNLDPFA